MFYNSILKRNLDLHSRTNDARKALDNDVILHYRCFKQTWSNTNAIWDHPDAISGQGFTTERVAVFYGKKGSAAVFVAGVLAYVIDHPNQKFKDDVHANNMTYANVAKDVYERSFHHTHDFWETIK